MTRKRFSVVTLPRLLAVLIAADIERARKRHEMTAEELAIIAEGTMRHVPGKDLARRLPGRSIATIHRYAYKMREAGLMWTPAALKRALVLAVILPAAKALAMVAR